MLNESNIDADRRQTLSALMDSELAPGQWSRVAGVWQQDADSRATWHCYHLIGDVMRSDELAHPAPHDAAMLVALRLRLAAEPVPLAPGALADSASPAGVAGVLPQAVAAGSTTQRRWLRRLRLPAAALAAGFLVVAGVMGVMRQGLPSASDGGQLALQGGNAVQPAVNTEVGTLVRDAGLDRYLEAHRKLGHSVAAAGAAEHRVQIVYDSK